VNAGIDDALNSPGYLQIRTGNTEVPTLFKEVHYGRDYDNAFWDGVQLVFGDGDGEIFGRFTRPVDVLGHELTHAVSASRTHSGAGESFNASGLPSMRTTNSTTTLPLASQPGASTKGCDSINCSDGGATGAGGVS